VSQTSTKAEEIRSTSIITRDFEKSGITAINLTLPRSGLGFREAMTGISQVLRAVKEDERLSIARTAEDIERAKNLNGVALIMAFQEPHGIEDKLDFIDLFYELGVRTIQLTYNNRGYIGDGCLEPVDAGLSAFGRKVVRRLNELGAVIDLSHCSRKTLLEACDLSEAPVVCTHANPRAKADNPRNKRDDELRAVAGTGGVVGISPWGPICWDGTERRPTLDDYVGLLEYTIDLVGIDHVGFGSDCPPDITKCPTEHLAHMASSYSGVVGEWNRAIGPGWDVRYCDGFRGFSMIENLVAALLERGYADADIRKILGENLLRVFRQVWK